MIFTRRACWHRWVCRHGYAANECSSGPYQCSRCGALWSSEREALRR